MLAVRLKWWTKNSNDTVLHKLQRNLSELNEGGGAGRRKNRDLADFQPMFNTFNSQVYRWLITSVLQFIDLIQPFSLLIVIKILFKSTLLDD